ncbi:hypothetical protein [Aureivirga marina]|uniref:hypothetical protein n=1 Tax=Aureivirga marina TaxID=1182451 RepID=UPI0018CB2BF9|nr:hypothetical protein [Aureivirga marina]
MNKSSSILLQFLLLFLFFSFHKTFAQKVISYNLKARHFSNYPLIYNKTQPIRLMAENVPADSIYIKSNDAEIDQDPNFKNMYHVIPKKKELIFFEVFKINKNDTIFVDKIYYSVRDDLIYFPSLMYHGNLFENTISLKEIDFKKAKFYADTLDDEVCWIYNMKLIQSFRILIIKENGEIKSIQNNSFDFTEDSLKLLETLEPKDKLYFIDILSKVLRSTKTIKLKPVEFLITK